MSPRVIAALRIAAVAAIILTLVLIFPKAMAFVELGARELLYFWWMILLIVLAVWLIWGLGGKKK
jgi:hypothetical protein